MQSKIYIRQFDYFNYPIKHISIFFQWQKAHWSHLDLATKLRCYGCPHSTSALILLRMMTNSSQASWVPEAKIDLSRMETERGYCRHHNHYHHNYHQHPSVLSCQHPRVLSCLDLTPAVSRFMSTPYLEPLCLKSLGTYRFSEPLMDESEQDTLVIPHQHSPHPVTVSQAFCVPALLPPWFLKLFFRKEFFLVDLSSGQSTPSGFHF